MVTLVAQLSSGKGSWAQVTSLIKAAKWDAIYLLCNEYSYQNFDIDPKTAIKIAFDENKAFENYEKLSKFFKTSVKDFEVALNISSGTGLEHMAIISAMLKAGLGLRFVTMHMGELKEFELLNEKYIPEENDNDEL